MLDVILQYYVVSAYLSCSYRVYVQLSCLLTQQLGAMYGYTIMVQHVDVP